MQHQSMQLSLHYTRT